MKKRQSITKQTTDAAPWHILVHDAILSNLNLFFMHELASKLNILNIHLSYSCRNGGGGGGGDVMSKAFQMSHYPFKLFW